MKPVLALTLLLCSVAAWGQDSKPDPNLCGGGCMMKPHTDPNQYPVTICGDECMSEINRPDPLKEIGKLTRVLNEQQSVIQTQQEQINDLQEKVDTLVEAVEELQKAKEQP